MDFQGKCIQFLGLTEGTSRTGNPWKKKEWLIETFGQYPRKVKVQCFGDRSDNINMVESHDYTLSVDLESREYQGRWYTDVNVFRVEEISNGSQPGNFPPGGNFPQGGYPQGGGYQQPPVNPGPYGNGNPFGGTQTAESGDEDLPF